MHQVGYGQRCFRIEPSYFYFIIQCYSEIRFTTKGESISIYQSVFTPSGGGKGGTLGPYKKDEITNDFLEGTLTSFVKSIYDKDWSFSSFPTR